MNLRKLIGYVAAFTLASSLAIAGPKEKQKKTPLENLVEKLKSDYCNKHPEKKSCKKGQEKQKPTFKPNPAPKPQYFERAVYPAPLIANCNSRLTDVIEEMNKDHPDGLGLSEDFVYRAECAYAETTEEKIIFSKFKPLKSTSGFELEIFGFDKPNPGWSFRKAYVDANRDGILEYVEIPSKDGLTMVKLPVTSELQKEFNKYIKILENSVGNASK